MKHEPRPAIPMEKQLGWAHKWDAAVSGDLQGGSNSVSQVNEVSDMTPACWLCGSAGQGEEKSEKRQWPVLALMTDSSASPSILLVPFKLPLQCWSSDGMSLSR